MTDLPEVKSRAALLELLRRRGLRSHRDRGQNFLVEGTAVARILEAAELQSDSTVLEIGPGLGALTLALASAARTVVAVEIDSGLVAALRDEILPGVPGVELHHADFLQWDIDARFPPGQPRCPVVANIPYKITSAILARLFERRDRFDRLLLMVQKEVADRLSAAPAEDDYSSLSVFMALSGAVRTVARIPSGSFLPRPDVDSVVLRIDLREQPLFADLPDADVMRTVRACFAQRRKQLLGCLVNARLGERSAVEAALTRAGIDPTRRGETLTLDEFAELTRRLR